MLGFFALILVVYYTYITWISSNVAWSPETAISLTVFCAPFVIVSVLKPVRRFLMSQRKIVAIPHVMSLVAMIGALYLQLDLAYYLAITLLFSPIIYAALAGRPDYMSLVGGFEDEEELKYYDKQALDVAKKFGGILTKVILVHEADMSLNTASKTLQRLVDHGVAKRVSVYASEIVDVPSSRAHLSKLDRDIIETLLTHNGITNSSQLVKALDVPIEALKRALLRLEVYGILSYDQYANEIKLRTIET